MSPLLLIYISRAKYQLTEVEVKELAGIAAQNNQYLDITGLLLHVGNYFIQVLEGDASAVSALLDQISRDKRHTDIRTIYKNHKGTRMFAQWNMGYFNLEHHYTVSRLDVESLKRFVAEAFANGENSAASLIQVIRSLPKLLEASSSDSSELKAS